jgi:hypothetical protein
VKGWGCIQEVYLSTTSLLTHPKLVIGIQLRRIDGKMYDEQSSRSIGKKITTLITCTISSVPVPVTGTCSITIYIYTTGSIIFTDNLL